MLQECTSCLLAFMCLLVLGFLSTDLKVIATLCSIHVIKCITRKYCPVNLSLNGHLVQHNKLYHRKVLLSISFHLNGYTSCRTLSTNSKVRTIFYSIINYTKRKVPLGSFRLNDHTLGFHRQTEKLEPPFISMGALTPELTCLHKSNSVQCNVCNEMLS